MAAVPVDYSRDPNGVDALGVELTIAIDDLEKRSALFGSADCNLRLIRAAQLDGGFASADPHIQRRPDQT